MERLEAGKFDYNLLSSVGQSKYFLLVLTPGALDRCLEDSEQNDWVHRVSYSGGTVGVPNVDYMNRKLCKHYKPKQASFQSWNRSTGLIWKSYLKT